MSTTTEPIEGSAPAPGADAHHGNYLTSTRGIRSWIFTLDHKRIGIMYLASVIFFFIVAGILALVVRTELMTAEPDLVSPDTYNQLFTLHGAIMIFLFIIPSIPASLGNFVLPLMVGAKDVAFPRLNLLSYHLYVLGALVLLYAIISGGIDTGWTFYAPYSTTTNTSVIAAVMGAFILGFSSILTGVNFMVTIHKMRAPGMTWMRMPLLLWGLYATAILQVLATPVLGITLFLLAMERWFGLDIFSSDPVLYQHFFWFYSHPAVYIMILPGMGVISELITVHAKKRIFGYKAIAYSSLAIAFISFLVWGHHMFTSGQSELASTIFSFLTFAVAVPTAIKVFSWTATLYKGSISLTTPMLYALYFIALFTIGGLTGVFLGALRVDIHLHDTYFVVAHFHYTMMGGVFIAFLGGLHHWWPKITGKLYHENLARIASVLIFIGFNVTFLSQFVVGTQGMPRRWHSYHKLSPELIPSFEFWHRSSTYGSYIMAVGMFLMLGYFLHSIFKGKAAPLNPWGGKSLEWATATPPITHNFEKAPVCTAGPYEFDEIDPSMGKEHV